MPFNTLKRARARRGRAAALALLLTAALTPQPSCSDNKAQQASSLLAAANTPQPGGGNTTMNPDPIADNLLEVLSSWGNRKVAVLERSVTLKSMWDETHSNSQAYEREGVAALRSKLLAHPFFIQRAEKLRRAHLVAGGAIQTQGQLYDFLAAS